jgi:hypothetical protein
MGVMKPSRNAHNTFGPIGMGLAAFLALSSIAGCANDSPDSSASPDSSLAAPTLEAQPSLSPNEIDADAEQDFRAALIKSQESAAKDGLTELWFDVDGQLVQVVAQDPKSQTCVSYDVDANSVFEMDETSMMPARTISELDGLIAGGIDQGAVKSESAGTFTITNIIDSSIYVTIYTLDSEGRIAESVVSSDDEPLGEITYTYSVTKEGKEALVALSESN